VESTVLAVAIAVAAGVGLVIGLVTYQRCPHCGHLVRRV